MSFQSKIPALIFVFIAAILIQSCSDDDPFRIDFSEAPPPFDTSQAVRDTTLAGNVQLFIIEEGEGPFEVVSRDVIEVQLTARTEDGRIVDSSFNNRFAGTSRVLTNLRPSPVPGSGRQVILLVQGLRKALLGMKEGESRTIIIPPEMGFTDQFGSLARRLGPRLNPGLDLRGETLTYDVELLNIL